MSEDRPLVLVETSEAGVAILRLNRVERRNALSRAMVAELQRAVASCRADRRLRALVIASVSPVAFCAGADLMERALMSDEEVGVFFTDMRRLMDAIADFPVPTVALIEGPALGGGLEMALACDIRLASTEAVLGLTETRLAVIPGAGGTQRLPRVVGLAAAKALVFTGRRVRGAEAQRLGLVHEAFASAEVEAGLAKWCDELASAGPLALRAAKKAMQEGVELSLARGLDLEREQALSLLSSEDRVEGLRAFREKRPPRYRGC